MMVEQTILWRDPAERSPATSRAFALRSAVNMLNWVGQIKHYSHYSHAGS